MEVWAHKLYRSRRFKQRLKKCRNEREVHSMLERSFRDEFVSEYASTLFCEDVAETFMFYLRYRNNLDKFKARSGVYKKLKAIQRAVAQARKELGT